MENAGIAVESEGDVPESLQDEYFGAFKGTHQNAPEVYGHFSDKSSDDKVQINIAGTESINDNRSLFERTLGIPLCQSVITATNANSVASSSQGIPLKQNNIGVDLKYLKGIEEGSKVGNSSNVDSVEKKTSVQVPVITRIIETVSDRLGNSSANKTPISNPMINRQLAYKSHKYGKVELYATDSGPKIYPVKGNIVTKPLITKNLPEAFKSLPVYGKSKSKKDLPNFYRKKMRDYVGFGISNSEFEKLEGFCSPEYLKTGDELSMSYNYPGQGSLPSDLKAIPEEEGPGQNLCIVKKLKLRLKKDKQNHYPRKLKYRGLRLLPLAQEDDRQSTSMNPEDGSEEELEPGKDLIFRIRFYRPHTYGIKDLKPNRHSVFNHDIVVLGRQTLTDLRDRIGCPNDVGMRIDVSHNPDSFCTQSAKHIFPSGFLFINNVFYVDRRPGCVDHSAVIREWARKRDLGEFPVRDMGAARLDEVILRLGHPEVYMHQGKCEHLFTFSEVRLVSPEDLLRVNMYPCYTAISQNQSVYCTTCAEFGAKWIVTGCTQVPFDPAFFCDTCFKLYLYDREGNKLGDFKAYAYRSNMVNFLKPMVALNADDEDGQMDLNVDVNMVVDVTDEVNMDGQQLNFNTSREETHEVYL